MTPVTIPDWNPSGLLPPIDPLFPTSPDRSPYRASLVELVRRFATSPERIDVLRGFLAFRAALHRSGFLSGFQWLDGSFAEDIETLERRPPRDLDVISFLEQPTPASPHLLPDDDRAFDHHRAKVDFKVDAYFIEIDLLPRREITEQAAYWYGLWSHRRDGQWKGFLQIELAPDDDPAATAALDQCSTQSGATFLPAERT